VIGSSNIANAVSVVLSAIFFAGFGLTLWGSASFSKLSVPMDSPEESPTNKEQ
jgi:type IV secretory pathway TrbD component